jgi:hypothetical protein
VITGLTSPISPKPRRGESGIGFQRRPAIGTVSLYAGHDAEHRDRHDEADEEHGQSRVDAVVEDDLVHVGHALGRAEHLAFRNRRTLATVVIFKMKRERYAFVTIIPTVWLCICTLTAGWQKIFGSGEKIFCQPAVRVQMHSQTVGMIVTKA